LANDVVAGVVDASVTAGVLGRLCVACVDKLISTTLRREDGGTGRCARETNAPPDARPKRGKK
jgi:hypothetical protein